MTVDDIHALVAEGEGETVEFKATTGQRSDAAKTVCAFLNRKGGTLVFGVLPEGQLSGLDVTERTVAQVVHELKKIEPLVPINPDSVPLPNGRVALVLDVPLGPDRPYTFDGRPYVRQGPTTSVMPRSQADRFVEERRYRGRRWEEVPAYRTTPADLDASEVTRTVEEAIRRGRMDEPGTRNTVALLGSLGLMRDGELLNAAVALFGRTNRLLPYYPQCSLRMARFRGITKDEFEDEAQIEGHVFEQFVRAQQFMRRHLPVAGRIVPDLFERIDDPLYPLEALREALANALCHRDYSIEGGSITLALYDDRLEITSSGKLPFNLTPADLKRAHASRPRNPIIASVLYRRGLIERWGRGTLKIVRLIDRAGLAEPEFEERTGDVVVRFFPTGYVPPSRISHDLTPLQQSLLALLANLGNAPLGDIEGHLSGSPARRTIQENLQVLRSLALVDLTGHGRGARWSLKGAHED